MFAWLGFLKVDVFSSEIGVELGVMVELNVVVHRSGLNRSATACDMIELTNDIRRGTRAGALCTRFLKLGSRKSAKSARGI